jgi:hypothetical protein
MSKTDSAYQTTACSGIVLSKIEQGIRRAWAMGSLRETEYKGLYQVTNEASMSEIASFSHPFVMRDADQIHVVVDIRPYTRWDQNQQMALVRDEENYHLEKLRGALTVLWNTASPSLLRSISPLGIQGYSAWVSDAVAKRFAIDPAEQMTVAALAALFYCSQFTNDESWGERDKILLQSVITQASNCKNEQAHDLVAKYPPIKNIEAFCAACREEEPTVRLNSLNDAVLITLLGGTWFGPNCRELTAVALEHPPTWLPLVYAAVRDRGYRNSGLAKLLERSQFKKHAQDFQRALLGLAQSIRKED